MNELNHQNVLQLKAHKSLPFVEIQLKKIAVFSFIIFQLVFLNFYSLSSLLRNVEAPIDRSFKSLLKGVERKIKAKSKMFLSL